MNQDTAKVRRGPIDRAQGEAGVSPPIRGYRLCPASFVNVHYRAPTGGWLPPNYWTVKLHVRGRNVVATLAVARSPHMKLVRLLVLRHGRSSRLLFLRQISDQGLGR